MKNYSKIILIFSLTFFFLSEAKCQWILLDSSRTLEDVGSRFYSKNGELFYCGLPKSNNDTLKYNFYLREDRADLIYFTQTNKQNTIVVSGFYKLTYKIEKIKEAASWSPDMQTCWIKDLVWFYFEKGILLKSEFYNNGVITQASSCSH